MGVKLKDPISVRAIASRLLQEKYGMTKVYGRFMRGSMYFTLPNHRGRKLRISDHRSYERQHGDVVVNIIFDQPTIVPDIEYQVEKAFKQYSRWKSKN